MTIVLVTDAEQRAALAVTRSLGQAGYVVHTASGTSRPLAAASRYSRASHAIPDPLNEPELYPEAVSRLAKRIGARVVLPVTDQSVLAILQHAACFSDLVLPLPSLESFVAASDKIRLGRIAAAHGFALPEQQVLVGPDAPADRLTFPLVVKPSRSVIYDSRRRVRVGVTHVADHAALERALRQLPPDAFPVLLQQRIVGPGLGLFLLRWDGRRVAAFAHQRVREKPPAGGVSVCSQSVAADPVLLARADAVLASLDWRGVAMVELKLQSDAGVAYLMEVNGRFWGSLQLAIDAGVDFPRMLVDLSLGRHVPEVSAWRSGTRLRWRLGELDHLITRFRHSDEDLGLQPDGPSRWRAAREILSPWSPGRGEILRWHDPLPGAVEILNWIRDL